MKSLYLTLPSQGGTNNTTSTFTVEFPHEIDLPGEWEVGLVEVLYPTSWYNIHEENNKVRLCFNNPDIEPSELEDCGNEEYRTYCLPVGYYDKAEAITNHLNSFIAAFFKKKASDFPGFLVDSEGYVHYRGGVDGWMTIHQDIADMLGLKNLYYSARSVGASMHPNFAMQNLYVYTDIIQPQIVGGSRADLLCIIPAKERNLHPARYTTHPIHYLPLQRHNFKSIQVNIRDVTGEPVAFACGHSVVKLHFRQVQTE